MSNIIDFNKFKEAREDSNELENKYLKFLTHVNKFTGIPTTCDKVMEVFYFTCRYLEGTVNGLSMLSILGINIPRKELEEGKKLLINWLQRIIEDIKNI